MKIITRLLLSITLLSTYSLYANQDNDLASEIKMCFAADATEYPVACKAAKKTYVSTNVFTYQYTTDGWLQQVAVYSDAIICTNMAGPRYGAQIVIRDNGKVLGLTDFYKSSRNKFTHKYAWGEVKTYTDHQEVTFY